MRDWKLGIFVSRRCDISASQSTAERELLRFLVAPALIFDHALLEAAFADDDAVGNADELHVGEHRARPLVAIVEEHLETGFGQRAIYRFGGIAHRAALAVADRDQGDMERRDRLRESDAALVVVLLDRGCHDAGDAHSIAAHLERTTVARLV